MKFKYILQNRFLFKIYLIYFNLKYKFFTNKKSYSQFGEDIVVNDYFGDLIGKYVDIGCYHPIKYSNTALLHKKGWQGVNIDLSSVSIDLFNSCRKNDENILACLSNKNEEVELFIDSELSALNSMYSDNKIKFKIQDIKRIKFKTKTFPQIIKDNFDFLNIDCEGNDLKILKTIDFKKFTPRLIVIEVSQNDKEEIYSYLNLNGYQIFKILNLSHIFKRS